MKIFKTFLIILLCSILFSTTVFAHPGRTDENGGHWDHSTGTYHYHNGGESYNDTKPSRDYDYDYDSYDYDDFDYQNFDYDGIY